MEWHRYEQLFTNISYDDNESTIYIYMVYEGIMIIKLDKIIT